MPPESRDPAHIWDMVRSAEAAVNTLQSVNLERYLQDENIQLLVERRIEIIGEAARRLSQTIREEHPEIPWRLIIAMRNLLIHEYDEIDQERIWRLVVEEIPVLVIQLKNLLDSMNEPGT